MPTNINDPDEIIRAVGRQEEQTLSLRDRMEGDYRLYRLEPYQEVDGYGQPVEGFRSYTSNAPQVYADKVIQWIARAEFGIRIPQGGRTRAQRAVDGLKEKWTWGLMRSVDRRIQQRMEPANARPDGVPQRRARDGGRALADDEHGVGRDGGGHDAVGPHSHLLGGRG